MTNKFNTLLKQNKFPVLPDVAQQLITLRIRKDIDYSELIQIIESDSILTSRIIRTANSAYSDLHHKVTTLEQAITTYGLKYIKSMALSFELVATLNNIVEVNFNQGDHWQQSLLRGVFARQLAKRYCPQLREEAFLIALLLDCGIPILAHIYGAQYIRLWQESRCSPIAKCKMEQQLFEFDHSTAGAALLRYWQLPEILSQLIQDHHEPPTSQVSREGRVQLRQIMYFVGSLPLHDFDLICEEDRSLWDFSRTTFGLEEADFLETLELSHQDFRQLSVLYSSFLPPQPDINHLLIQIRALSNCYRERVSTSFHCQTEIQNLKERESHAIDAISVDEQQVLIDGLTGLVTRPLFMKYLTYACQKVRDGNASLTVLYIDLDDFMAVNERYGETGGNRVLEEVADLLQSYTHDKGCIARYDGDAFVLALLDISAQQALQLTKGLTEQIRQLDINLRSSYGRDKVKLTASMGMLFCEPNAPVSNAMRTLEFADQQMYQVKNQRKDGFSYIVLNSVPQEGRQTTGASSVPV
jgi:diguanylate cyclase (GGDEF)-like protein